MKRSVMSFLVELHLRLTEKHYSDKKLQRDIESRRKNGDIPYSLPRKIAKKYSFSEKQYKGMQVFSINEEEKSDRVVLYLHGGAYYRKPRDYHFSFMGEISENTKIPFIAPIYGKAPNHTPMEAYEILSSLYFQLQEKYNEVIFMGDSSGGGLAIGLALYLKEMGHKLPSSIVLLCPWMDVSLTNENIKDYIKKEPIVFFDNAQVLGRLWAGNLPIDDYRVSPIYGDMRGLPETHIFCGTREVLYPDCVLAYERLKESGVDAYLYIGEGQNHVYPIYPLIKEAKIARRQIENIIKKDSTS